MFKLIRQLAWSNLVKNRQLYYPFGLATILSVAILYVFLSLNLNPHLGSVYGGEAVKTVMGLGVFIVVIAIAAIVNYANGFVMKNRSKEMGLYEILGLNKGHLVHMMGLELVIFAIFAIGLGVGFGIAFDQLIYALLLKLMSWKVDLVATFQWQTVVTTLLISGFIFAIAWISNLWKLLRLKALDLNRESKKGEKKARFLLLKTLVGLALVGSGYFIAITVKSPVTAIMSFFGAVLLVIAGTYLLFNAGITVLLQRLKKRASYYQPNNFIAISNLIFRMKKNAMGLATIAILSTMVLITMIGGANIYMGSEAFIRKSAPAEFGWRIHPSESELPKVEDIEAKLTEFTINHGIESDKPQAYRLASSGINRQEGNQFSLYDSQSIGMPDAYMTILDETSYEKLTGQSIDLGANEVLINQAGLNLDLEQELTIQGQNFRIKETFTEPILDGKVPTEVENMVDNNIVLVVKDVMQATAGMEVPNADSTQVTSLSHYIYAGLNPDFAHYSEQEREELTGAFQRFSTSNAQTTDFMLMAILKSERSQEIKSMMGSVFFMGLLLSIIFMLGTVLVIYYKQISEGYEDRDNFVILQKVGLDQDQTNHTIRKQVLTVFFLPLIFAFSHLAASFNMISKIIKLMVPTQTSLILMVTVITALIFALVYFLVFGITSRSYRKIVSR